MILLAMLALHKSKGKPDMTVIEHDGKVSTQIREEMKDRRRILMPSLTLEEMQGNNAHCRAWRQSLPPEQRQALLDRHKANYYV